MSIDISALGDDLMHGWRPTDRLANLLDRAVDRLDEATPEELAQSAPHSADQLLPLLQVADRLRASGQVRMSDAARERARARMHQALTRQRRRLVRRPGTSALPRLALAVALVVLLLIGSLSSITAVAARSLPGDALYTWKRASEEIWLRVQPSPARAARVALTLANRRVEEAQRLFETRGVVEPTLGATLTNEYRRALALLASAPPAAVPQLSDQLRQASAEHAAVLSALAAQTSGPQRAALASAAEISIQIQQAVEQQRLTPDQLPLPPGRATTAPPTATVSPRPTLAVTIGEPGPMLVPSTAPSPGPPHTPPLDTASPAVPLPSPTTQPPMIGVPSVPPPASPSVPAHNGPPRATPTIPAVVLPPPPPPQPPVPTSVPPTDTPVPTLAPSATPVPTPAPSDTPIPTASPEPPRGKPTDVPGPPPEPPGKPTDVPGPPPEPPGKPPEPPGRGRP